MKINEDNVVQQVKKRNEDALDYMIDHYGGFIKSIVNRHLYQFPHTQEECINDILLGIWNNIESFSPEKNTFKNWVAAIAKYKSIDYKRKHVKFLEEQSLDDDQLVKLENQMSETKKELSCAMESLLQHLQPRDRQLFIHYYVNGEDTATLAEEFQVKKSAIHNRLSRGRKKLRTLFRNT